MFQLEPLHTPTLTLVAGLVLLTASGIMTLAGVAQRTYRGYWWWTAAQWGNTIAAAAMLLKDAHPAMLAASVFFSLQWPITMLGGMRRFYVRSPLPTSPWFDALFLIGGFLSWLWVWGINPDDVGARVATFSLINILGYLYCAWVIKAIRDWRHSPYLKAILCFLIGGALIQVPRLMTGVAGWGVSVSDQSYIQLPAVMLGLVVGAMFSVYMCLLLTYERTEHDLRESHRQLRVLADFDMLTQVPNRRHFNEIATQTMRLSAPGTTSLMLLDIDHFKQLNDHFGHAAGDEALKLVAGSARKMLRSRDLLGRLGGDEFIALLPETSVNDALHVADRMVRHVDAERSILEQSTLSLSFGVVQIMPGESLPEATHRADQALYEAKRQGRRRAVAAEDDDGEAVFTTTRPFGLSTY
ncbi:MAG: GGDEF domain-containing protein [Burkholderiales bacterium]|nr:GGDEF domain-containing protein [Burkholderiales bacterium]